MATAFFGVALEVARDVGGQPQRKLPDIAAAFAANALTIIEQHRIVDLIRSLHVQTTMINDLDGLSSRCCEAEAWCSADACDHGRSD